MMGASLRGASSFVAMVHAGMITATVVDDFEVEVVATMVAAFLRLYVPGSVAPPTVSAPHTAGRAQTWVHSCHCPILPPASSRQRMAEAQGHGRLAPVRRRCHRYSNKSLRPKEIWNERCYPGALLTNGHQLCQRKGIRQGERPPKRGHFQNGLTTVKHSFASRFSLRHSRFATAAMVSLWCSCLCGIPVHLEIFLKWAGWWGCGASNCPWGRHDEVCLNSQLWLLPGTVVRWLQRSRGPAHNTHPLPGKHTHTLPQPATALCCCSTVCVVCSCGCACVPQERGRGHECPGGGAVPTLEPD